MHILLLGGVGSGKSTVLHILQKKYQALVLEADKMAHVLYQRGERGYEALVQLYGEGILNPQGEIDRGKLGDILYRDPKEMQRVNGLIHPMVEEEIQRELKKHPGELVVVEQAPLPSCREWFDQIWYLHTGDQIRMERLMKNRGYTRERTLEIFQNQPDMKAYKEAADLVLENNSDEKSLEEEIQRALGR